MKDASARDLYLGVDLGTTALKLGVFEADGSCLGYGHAEYMLHSPHEGWAEQDAQMWWDAFEASLRQVRESVDLQRVAAISVVAQSPTVVPIAADGRPLRRAITWADRRSVKEARWLSSRLGLGDVNVDFEALPRIVWIRDHEPEIYRQTRWFMQTFDYLPFRLTGRAVTIRSLPGLEPWTDEKLAAAGLDRDRFPDEMLSPGETIGCLDPAVAGDLGLRPDTLVISGTVDAFSHWIGVDLSMPGTLCNIGGTSEGVSLAWPEPLPDPVHRVFVLPSPFGSGFIVGGAMSNSGGLLDWSVRTFGGPGATRDGLQADMSGVPAGSAGLLALPYFMGERTPIYDPDARGVFFGLNPNHTGAHMARALLEGVALALRQIIEVQEEIGGEVGELVVTGGTANSRLWNRIKADVTGRPVKVTAVKASGVLGAAIMARSSATLTPLSQVSREMVKFTEVIEPDSTNKAAYDRIYPLFLELYGSLRESFGRLASLGEPERVTAFRQVQDERSS